MAGHWSTDALAFAGRKKSSGPFASGLTPVDRREALELAAAAVRTELHVDVNRGLEQLRPVDQLARLEPAVPQRLLMAGTPSRRRFSQQSLD